jgi:endonuclease/exonuclease/phosphatase (EEP) superfamily protein YafD
MLRATLRTGAERFPVAATATPPVTSAPTSATAASPAQRRLGGQATRRVWAPARRGRVTARSSASTSGRPASSSGVGEEIHGERGALVVAGDFNATRHHPSFRRLLSDGMADAHEERGRGWAATWPRNRRPLPPLMRLDHVLVSPGVGVRSIREGLGQGSDHRPIIADLVLLP